MDARELAVKGELISHLPHASDAELSHAAREWIRWIGRATLPDEASAGLLAEFLHRFGAGGASESMSRH